MYDTAVGVRLTSTQRQTHCVLSTPIIYPVAVPEFRHASPLAPVVQGVVALSQLLPMNPLVQVQLHVDVLDPVNVPVAVPEFRQAAPSAPVVHGVV